MVTKDFIYQIDGKTFTGYLADGSRDRPAPGIMVIHQGLGMSDHTRERARMLAELGYVAFAADMFGEVATSREHAMSLITGVTGNPPLLRQRARAGLDVLTAHATTDRTRLAAIGFCFGGAVVLELARVHPELACVVAFHPGLTQLPETDSRKIAGKVMVCAGAHDPLIPPAARDRLISLMTAIDADWQLLTYGKAGHGFTDRTVGQFNLPGFFHDEPTDKRSWAAMRHLFEEAFGPV